MSVQVDFQQYAVGKGGFNSFVVTYGNGEKMQRYSYVYDCGGRKDLVNRELKELVSEYGLQHDLFILSHFDRDHYSGMLLFKKHGVKFDKILIPVFTVEQFLIELALSKTGMAILETLHEYRDHIIIITNDRFLEPSDPDNMSRIVRGPTHEITLKTSASTVWELQFLATRGPQMAEKKYESIRNYVEIEEVRKHLSGFEFNSLKKHVRSLKRKIRKVKKDFDFNLNSLVLASYRPGPMVMKDFPADCVLACGGSAKVDLHKIFGECRESQFGFLNTGDFNLKNKTLRLALDAWLQDYEKYIGFYQLPHHGSKLSYSDGWFKSRLTNCKFAVTGVQGPNRKRSGQLFPGPSVVNSLKKMGMPLLWSTSKVFTRTKIRCYSGL